MPAKENSVPAADILAPLDPSPTYKDPLPYLDRKALRDDGSCEVRRGDDVMRDAEVMLNEMIGECRFLMREVAFRSMLQTAVPGDRMDFLRSAMSLAETGAGVARTIAQLRAVPLLADSLVADLEPKKTSARRKKAPHEKQ